MTNTSKILIGWREWVALPELKLPAIKAKVDTGAKTSSLHAFDIQTYLANGGLRVKFRMHPVQRRSDIIVNCDAPVVDYRLVSDSGGHRERRYVIVTTLVIGGLSYPIEMTLANRETLSHRMLIGRGAMRPLLIDPLHSYLLGRRDKTSKLYGGKKKSPRKKPGSRA